MAPNLDDLIERLLDQIVLSGKDGVSLSQLLAFIDACYDGPGEQSRGAPEGGASPAGPGNPTIDHNFKSEVWKSFKVHPDVLVGEDKCGNHLSLTEIEALPSTATEDLSHPEGSLSPTKDLVPLKRGNRTFVEDDSEGLSSSSAQLPANRESTSSVYDSAEDVNVNDTQTQSQGSKPANHRSEPSPRNSRRDSSSHTAHGLGNDKMVDTVVVHARRALEATELIGQERFPITSRPLTSQPRIYVSQERRWQTITTHGTNYREVPKLQSLANPPKRRGRPPKVKNRAGPPKARASNTTLNVSLLMLQQTPTKEAHGNENAVTSEHTPMTKKRGGRQSLKVALYTSHDESQRDAGMPGVYFDLTEFGTTGAGRPKRRKIALFKSEKLKSLPWMNGDTGGAKIGTIDHPFNVVQSALVSSPTRDLIQENGTTRKGSLVSEMEAARDEPQPRRLLLDTVQDFGRPHPVPYKSPYRSPPATFYVSPYIADASIVTPSTTLNKSLQQIPTAMSAHIQTLLPSATAKASAIVSKYSSPYPPIQLTSSQLLGLSSMSNYSAAQLPAIETSYRIRDVQFEAAIKSAGRLVIPDVTTRLPSSKDGVVGNLCLLTDKKSLIFMSEEMRTDPTPNTIKVSDIVEPPQILTVDSETKVLRITTSSTNSVEEIYHFRFLPTEDAFSAANNMRAKIVTGMMILDLEDENNVEESEKPYKCSGCRGSWKNWEGLKYHQTKSKTLCNPNYTPRINLQASPNTDIPSESKEPALLTGQDVLETAAGVLDHASAQHWADRSVTAFLSGDVMAGSKKSSLSKRSYDDISSASDVEQRPAKRPKRTVASTKIKDARSDPEIQRAKDIIMALLDANEQAFPGDKSLWFACVAASLEKVPDSDLLSYDVCNIALNLLEDTGQVRKVQFSFKDETGLMKMRTLITRHDVDPTSTAVMAMKKNIKTSFPEYHVPPGFAPPKMIQAMLEARQNDPEVADNAHTQHKAAPAPRDHNLVVQHEPETLHMPFNYTPSSKVTRSGRISRRPQRLLAVDNNLLLQSSVQNLEEALNNEDDDSYAEDLLNNDLISRTSNSATGDRRKGRWSKSFETNLEGSNPIQGMKSRPEVNRTARTARPQPMRDGSQQAPNLNPSQCKQRRHYMRPAGAASDRNATWQPVLTYLQGKNGAWNVQTPPRVTRKYALKAGLPEPITYMQNLDDSAWDFRPYGHGVRPIHARPAKRAEGQTAYLTRIHNGFRPVMMPNGDIYIPSTPSKYTRDEALNTTTEGLAPSATSTAKKRKYTRRSSKFSKSQVEIPPPSPKKRRVTVPKRAPVISTPPTLLPDIEYTSRQRSLVADSSPFLSDFDQRIQNASLVSGREPAPFNDRFQAHVTHPNRTLKHGAERSRNIRNSSVAHLGSYPPIHNTLAPSVQVFFQPTVRFLTPNAAINAEPGDPDPVSTLPRSRQSSVSNDSEYISVGSTGNLSEVTSIIDEPYSVRWQEPEVLTGLSGLWPFKSDKEFEIGSFTLKGWFPSAAFTLKQLLPRDLDGILATKEARKVIAEKHPSPQWAAFLSDIDVVEKWEEGKAKDLLGIGTVAPDCIFINHTLNTLECPDSSNSPQLQWFDENSLTLETFSYDELDSARENEKLIVPEQQHQRVRDGKAGGSNQRAPIAQYMMTTRRLTALPADLEGISKSFADHPDLKVEVAVDHQHNIRRRTREGAMSADTDCRLMVAVVVIRTLTGGLDKQVDWVLVSKLFPDFPMNAVLKRWPILYRKHKQMIERLGPDFQEFFLDAYEKGEVCPIDYDHLLEYDWNGLVDLVLEQIDINPSKITTHGLSASRSNLNQMFNMNNVDDNRAWRDEYFGILPAIYKRMEYAASEQHTMAISQKSLAPDLNVDKFTVAKSWARANTLTPAGSYNKDFAARKLAMIGNGMVAAATSALFESKVLMQRNKGRPTPNRGVEITDTFASALRKHLDETHLTQAAAFKASLDAKLRADEVVMVEWTANDGEILAITNLQAHGRIKIEPKGVPMNRFGLTGGGYQTKRMDKAKLRFDLQILPTPSYIFDGDLPILSALTSECSPPRGIAGAIPVWFDIGENLMPAMWKKVLCVVLATIAMRPGVDIKELVRIFTPVLEEWEMRVLVEWAIGVRSLVCLREGFEGWNVGEWWWVIGGRA